MGILSSAWKSIKNGFKKVFKPVIKLFSKVMNNKFFKMAMVAVSVFTAGASLLAAAGQGGWKAVGNLILKKAAEVVTMPIDIISKGIGAVGNFTGIETLKSFAGSISQGLEGFRDMAGSVFEVADQAGDVAGSFAGVDENGAPTISEQFSEDALGDAPLDAVGGDKAAGVGVEGAGGSGGFDLVGDADGTKIIGMDGNEMAPGAVTPKPGLLSRIGETVGGMFGDKGASIGGGIGGAIGNVVGGASSLIEDNPQTSKVLFDMIAGGLSPNEAEMRYDYWKDVDKEYAPYANTGYGGSYSQNLRPLQQQNAGLLRRGAAAQSSPVLNYYGT